MTDGLGESAGAASTEARSTLALAQEVHVQFDRMAHNQWTVDFAQECPCCAVIADLVERVSRERERAALERAAKILRGALYCIDNHYGVSGAGPCDCDQAIAARAFLSPPIVVHGETCPAKGFRDPAHPLCTCRALLGAE